MSQPVTKLSAPQQFIKLPAVAALFELPTKFAVAAGKAVRSIPPFLASVSKMAPSASLGQGIRATKLFAFVDSFFVLPGFINQTIGTARATTPTERVARLWQSIISGRVLIDCFADTVDALRAFTVISQEALPWTTKLAPFFLPIKTVAFMLGTYQLAEHKEFYNEFKARVKPLTAKASVTEITAACNYIISNKERIQKSLEIGPEAKIDEKAQAILSAIQAEQKDAVKQSQAFMKTLSTRASLKLGVETAAVALTAADLATSAFLLFTPPTPLKLGALTTILLLHVARMATGACLMKKDPFAESWFSKAFHAVQAKVAFTAACVKNVFQKTAPAC